LAISCPVKVINFSSGSYEGIITIVFMVCHRSPGGGASPFRLDNYTLHHELKTYLKAVEKNKKAR